MAGTLVSVRREHIGEGGAGRIASVVKAEVRAALRARRAERAARPGASDARAAGAAALLAQARGAGLLEGAAPGSPHPAVAVYLATPVEPDVSAIIDQLRQSGGRVLLPVPRPGRVLEWVLASGRQAPHPRLPVPIPVGPSLGQGAGVLLEHGVGLVLVPALAVDRSGTRMGQGGGYYDVLLTELTALVADLAGPAPLVVAVVHDDEVLPAGALPREPFDVPVQLALTPGGLVRLDAGTVR